jgi:hypothetical protein
LLRDIVPDGVPVVCVPARFRARQARQQTAAAERKMKIVTQAEIMAKRTPAGGWTRAQLAEWGVPWPPPKGWKQALMEVERAARLENLESST